MANYFVDSTTGSDGDNGTTMDLAWATLKYALESGGLVAGDNVFVRRLHSETLGAEVGCVYDGTPSSPIKIIGWPRAADATADGASWTNGSTTVDLVTTLSMSTEAHVSRFVTAPDGQDYLITLVTDSDTFTIDRKYAGSSVTLSNGAFTVKADDNWVDDMGAEHGFDDSAWTIKESAWDADADDLPQMEQSTFKIYMYNDRAHWFENMHFTILMHAYICKRTYFRGCYFDWAANGAKLTVVHGIGYVERSVFKGQSDSTGEYGMSVSTGKLYIKDCAVYNMGRASLSMTSSECYIDGFNSAVEMPNDFWDVTASYGYNRIVAKDTIWGDGDLGISIMGEFTIETENDGKVLGAHTRYTDQGSIIKVDVVEGSGDPYKRVGGADSVIEILHDIADNDNHNANPPKESAPEVFNHEFEVDDLPKSYRYYVQAEGAVAADELWIELDYINTYDDTSKYTTKKVISVESIAARSGADDWSQYLEVNNITPAVASKVRIKCYCRYADAVNKIYIDPQPRVS